MKRKILYITLGTALCVALCCCGNGEKFTDTDSLFNENPVTIDWKDNKDENIYSFSTDVSVYSMNNRKDTSFNISNKYRLAMKKINDVIYTRIDLDADKNGGKARSVISNDKEMLVVDTNTNEIEYRVPVENTTSNDLAFLENETGLSRINLDYIKSESKRLAFDVSEESDGSLLTVEVPASYMPSSDSEKKKSVKVSFDTIDETLNTIENVSILSDGTEVTSTVHPVYEDCDGEPVKVGSITIIDSKSPDKIEGFEDGYETYGSIDDIPEINSDELDKMQEAGNVFEDNNITFGDPADQSCTETVVEKYVSVEINNTSDSEFKLLLEE